MPSIPVLPRRNTLLAALPQDERTALSHDLKPVRLQVGESLAVSDQPAEFVWFPSNGVTSSVSTMSDGGVVELATTGREGFVGIAPLLGATAEPHTAIIQVAGHGDRLTVDSFRRYLRELPSFQPLLLRYALAFLGQVAQSAACNRLHALEARCARWLLQTHDRVDGNRFALTQEFLGQMLGVTRPSVSLAAGMLQKAGYIRYVRGVIEVTDRQGLESSSCECYQIILRQYSRLLDYPSRAQAAQS